MIPTLGLANATARPYADVPVHPLGLLLELVSTAPSRDRRVSALFVREHANTRELVAVLADDTAGRLEIARAILDGDAFPSMTPACPEVHLFEREIAELHGVTPTAHPWLKPVRFTSSEIGVTDYYAIEGEEVHEVAVGPVHAGVIEPGHFRFQCHGEVVMHLEISLGYQHRGVERGLASGPDKRSIHYAETLAGDTTVGHATAYALAVEALAGARVPARALAIRGIGLELERLANHTGDLGALANDIGFLPTASYCGRLRGDYLNLTAALCGSRFGRGLVRPGGVGFDVTDGNALAERLDRAARDTAIAITLLWDTASVQARFEDTGPLTEILASQLGLVGIAGRACGLVRDVRKTHPVGIYRFAHIPISTWPSGDVFARAYVRWLEIERSVQFIASQLRALPSGPIKAPVAPPRPDHISVSLVEGWRGEICHVAITDGAGKFASYKVVDPSFHNWMGLAIALREQQISDFPLCNKSFNLSYCGHDL